MSSVAYGEWESPLSPAQAAGAATRFAGLGMQRDPRGRAVLWWAETRPLERGRIAIVRCVDDDRVEPPARTVRPRSRVNEYGGGLFWVDGSRCFWVDDDTQRVMASAFDATERRWADAVPLTPLPPQQRTWRHSGGTTTPDGAWTICERELHQDVDGRTPAEPINDLVAIRADVSAASTTLPTRLIGPEDLGGGDFTAAPTLSPDGSVLAWLRWDHPDMPWDGAELWAAHVVRDDPAAIRLDAARRVAGGRDGGAARRLDRSVAVCLPEWSPDGRLWWCDDSTDWWTLYRAEVPGLPDRGAGDHAVAVLAETDVDDEEIGEPRWVAGGHRYGFCDDGRVVFAASSGGLDSAWIADPRTGARERLSGPEWCSIDVLMVTGDTVALIGGEPDTPTTIWRVDLDAGTAVDLRPTPAPLERDWVSHAVPVVFPTGAGATATAQGAADPEAVSHGLFYPPRSGDHTGPTGTLPPVLVRIHGGPTAAARPEFSTSVQFWTTRGVAVIDVNYRGSTGFGRRYRDELLGRWGEADIEDCLAAVRHLADEGLVDGERCVIRGGSAGGFTTLAVLCFQADLGADGTFAAGCSLYGVTDLAALASDTHKFESRYLDGLVGALPDAADVYRSRSPLFHADHLRTPVLLLQGSEDKVVPPSQAEVLVAELEAHSVPHAYVLFEGEGHGFQDSDTIVKALGYELDFYGQVLGFTPADDLPPVPLVR